MYMYQHLRFKKYIKCIRISVCVSSLLKILVNLLPYRDAFANRADPDQAALLRAARSGPTLLAYENMI